MNDGNDGVNDGLMRFRVWENNRCDTCDNFVSNNGSRTVSNVSKKWLLGIISCVYIVWFWGTKIVTITWRCIIPMDLTLLIFLMLLIETRHIFWKYLIVVKFIIEIRLRSAGIESVIKVIILKLGNILIAIHDFSWWITFTLILNVSSNVMIVLFVTDFWSISHFFTCSLSFIRHNSNFNRTIVYKSTF